jgi:hypothetical protein
MTNDDDPFRRFEEAGEQQVRINLARKTYDSRRTHLAEAWLAQKERSSGEAASVEQRRIARSAKNAAWVAATAAIIAVVVAAISASIAYVSLTQG